MNDASTPIQIDENKKVYFLNIEGHMAKIEFIKTSDKIYLTHTKVPEALKGKGVATFLLKKVLEDIEGRGLKIVPLCPFIIAYFEKHPELKNLLAKEAQK